jgi:hypothetical protein
VRANPLKKLVGMRRFELPTPSSRTKFYIKDMKKDELDKQVSEKILKDKVWPKTPQILSSRLRRLAPTMRATGIDICFEKVGHNRRRVIEIRKVMENSVCAVRNDLSNSNKGLDADDTADDEKIPRPRLIL